MISLGTRTIQQGTRAFPVYTNCQRCQSSFPVGGRVSFGLYSGPWQNCFSWPLFFSVVKTVRPRTFCRRLASKARFSYVFRSDGGVVCPKGTTLKFTRYLSLPGVWVSSSPSDTFCPLPPGTG